MQTNHLRCEGKGKENNSNMHIQQAMGVPQQLQSKHAVECCDATRAHLLAVAAMGSVGTRQGLSCGGVRQAAKSGLPNFAK
jgi:hypothetical protein